MSLLFIVINFKIFNFRPELRAIEKETEVVLRFPETEPLSPPILQLNDVGFYYTKDKIIYTSINVGATLESRICIVSLFFYNIEI